MTTYYNEIDPFAAAWLRELIAAGHIAPGLVDERSIVDVKPQELEKFTQCHLFAGIGVWSYALRQAGWPDDKPVWTGSCPCQPFSQAGKRKGIADERHLWPAWYWLIEQCRPPVIVGEQVGSKSAEPWIDAVQTDLEALDYAFGCVAFPAASVGAPHIRDRAYWVAYSHDARPQGRRKRGYGPNQRAVGSSSLVGGMGNPHCDRPETRIVTAKRARLGYTPFANGDSQRPGPANSHWGIADWIGCRDRKWRAVESGTFPLVDESPARVGRLRGYGNAIVAEQAKTFIVSAVDAIAENVQTVQSGTKRESR